MKCPSVRAVDGCSVVTMLHGPVVISADLDMHHIFCVASDAKVQYVSLAQPAVCGQQQGRCSTLCQLYHADRTKGIAPRLLPWLVAANPVNFGALSRGCCTQALHALKHALALHMAMAHVLQRPVIDDIPCTARL
jgi:hypothetical protein